MVPKTLTVKQRSQLQFNDVSGISLDFTGKNIALSKRFFFSKLGDFNAAGSAIFRLKYCSDASLVFELIEIWNLIVRFAPTQNKGTHQRKGRAQK